MSILFLSGTTELGTTSSVFFWSNLFAGICSIIIYLRLFLEGGFKYGLCLSGFSGGTELTE